MKNAPVVERNCLNFNKIYIIYKPDTFYTLQCLKSIVMATLNVFMHNY